MGPGPSWAEALRARANSSVDGSSNKKDIFTCVFLILRCGQRCLGLDARSQAAA